MICNPQEKLANVLVVKALPPIQSAQIARYYEIGKVFEKFALILKVPPHRGNFADTLKCYGIGKSV